VSAPALGLELEAIGTSTTVVISPHLDDAVLSVGGSIATWTAAGERVVVATVFTDGPPPERITRAMRPFADYQARRAEDAAACAALGADVHWLGLVERAFREPFLPASACFTTPVDRFGFAMLPAVTASLAALEPLEPERILVPLGVGNHVDHVEVMVAATEWAIARGWRERLRFYEDFYALSGMMRRAHSIAAPRRWPLWRSPLRRAPRLALTLGSIALARRGPAVTAFLAPQLARARWSAAPVVIDESRKLAAAAHYRSQVRAFGGIEGIGSAWHAYHAWCGGEPLWHAHD
jgi:LmbE family N-acetylglucosaminyl deacetylase